MSYYFKVERLADDLTRTLYKFIVLDDYKVFLEDVVEETRTTKRHGWKGTMTYSRLYKRDAPNAEPSIPEDVTVEAVQRARDQIVFCKWKDRW